MQVKRLATLRWLMVLAIATSTVGTTSTRYAVAQDKAALRGPYLAMGTPQSMMVVWRTGGASQPVVRIGTTPQQLNRAITGDAIKARTLGAANEPLSAAPTNTFQYEATISGLTPATRYYYAVYDGEKLIAGGDESYSFTTHPPVASKNPFRFWVVGDSGTGDKHQLAVRNAMQGFIADQKRPLDFYVHVGDMAYSTGKDEEFQRNFFAPYGEILRRMVCWPTMGNHEGINASGKTGIGPYYDAYVTPTRGEVGGLASGTEAYYSFDYANTHFICLNSHDLDRAPTAAMAQWLKADLEATRSDWIVAFWHHPPYSKGTHDSDKETQLIEMRQHILPILESAGVDVVLTGHSHIYERSMLIDGAYGTPTVAENFVLNDGDGDPAGDGAYRKSAGLHPHEGAVQVVTGNGGAGLGRSGTVPIMKRVFVEHGSVIVDVAGDTLTAVMVNTEGKQRDLFSIVKRGQVTPQRIAKPKQLPPYIRLDSLARIALQNLPRPGVKTRATVDFQEIPENTVVKGATAEIVWDTTNTSWQVVPKEAVVPLVEKRTAQQPFSFSYTKNIFPLPTAKITYNTGKDEGDEEEEGTHQGVSTTVGLNIALMPYRQAPLRPMRVAPTIDGVLTAKELAGLSRQTDFIIYRGTGIARHPTEFYAGLRGNKLYLAIINHEPDMAKLQVVNREFDGTLWSDDGSEIFLQREGANEHYQLILNAAGQRYDSIGTDIKWNGNWSTAVKRGPDRWISESLISLDMLGPLKTRDVIRFNVVRNNQVQGETSQWSHTNRAGNHSPQYFGRLIVGGK